MYNCETRGLVQKGGSTYSELRVSLFSGTNCCVWYLIVLILFQIVFRCSSCQRGLHGIVV